MGWHRGQEGELKYHVLKPALGFHLHTSPPTPALQQPYQKADFLPIAVLQPSPVTVTFINEPVAFGLRSTLSWHSHSYMGYIITM